MMRFFLKAKHWQVFLVFLIGTFNSNFTYVDRPTITIIVRLTGILISFSWVLFVGAGLYDYLPKKAHFNYSLFLINFFICVTAYTSMMILSDGEGMTFSGLAAIPMFYVAYAFLQTFTFPVKLLKSIELGDRANLSEYIGTLFQLIFWPIGIWFVQPRVNSIAAERIAKDEL